MRETWTAVYATWGDLDTEEFTSLDAAVAELFRMEATGNTVAVRVCGPDGSVAVTRGDADWQRRHEAWVDA